MRLDVFLLPSEITPGALTGRVVAVVDVLRASTTIAVALANGARAVVPLPDADEVAARAKQFERAAVLMAGERRMLPMPGFDLGNSPREFSPDVVSGKTVLIATTNGTRAMLAIQGARDIVVAAYVNCSAVAALLRTAIRSGVDVAVVCSGHERHFALEDAACAGRLASLVTYRFQGVQMNDAARACSLVDARYADNLAGLFQDASHGQALSTAGFAGDLILAAELDSYPVVPIYQDRQITRLGPDRER